MGNYASKNDLDPRRQRHGANATVLNREVYYAGKDIIKQGEEGARAFYIDRGRVEVLIIEDGHELKVAELGPGELFGEMSLITNHTRTATVRAIDDCAVTVISQHKVDEYLRGVNDKATRKLIAVLMDRLHDSTQAQMHHYKSLTDFQDRVTGMVDRIDAGIDQDKREEFRKEVSPLLRDLQDVLDRYKR